MTPVVISIIVLAIMVIGLTVVLLKVLEIFLHNNFPSNHNKGDNGWPKVKWWHYSILVLLYISIIMHALELMEQVNKTAPQPKFIPIKETLYKRTY